MIGRGIAVAACLGVGLIFVLILGLVVSIGGDASADCGTGATASVTQGKVPKDPTGKRKPVQMRNATTIIALSGKHFKKDQVRIRASVIAIATALQESKLRNLASEKNPASKQYPHDAVRPGDHDSVGIFQQRPSQGWGTIKELMQVPIATNKFYAKLKTINGWRGMALTDAAQAVQNSGFPSAYAKWENEAERVVALLSDLPSVQAVGGGAPEAPCGAAASTEVSPHGWAKPVNAPVSSGFRTSDRPTHDGVDMSTKRGTRTYAAANGKVVFAGCDPDTPNCDIDGSEETDGCGWYVMIRHKDGVSTLYCHMVARPEVDVGQRVVTGQVIGLVGTSGSSTGPHLHFEVAIDGAETNPVPFMRRKGVTL